MISNVVSVLVLTSICSVLLIYFVGYFRLPRGEYRAAYFAQKYKPLLALTYWSRARNDNWKNILVPVYFFTKRLLFVSILITATSFLWIQVALLNFTTLASLNYTLGYKPFNSIKANALEVFNDCTVLVLTYHLWCFTDMVKEPETRHGLGYVFIAVCFVNIGVHIINMLSETIHKAKLSYKRY